MPLEDFLIMMDGDSLFSFSCSPSDSSDNESAEFPDITAHTRAHTHTRRECKASAQLNDFTTLSCLFYCILIFPETKIQYKKYSNKVESNEMNRERGEREGGERGDFIVACTIVMVYIFTV